MGRRTAKINLSSKRIKRFLWDGNVPLHEWEYDLSERPNLSRDKDNLLVYDKEEPVTDNLITWVFDENSFVPAAKLVGDKSYSILTDHLGTPYEAYDENGEKVWARELDLYGNAITGDSSFIPFLYQGQYYDEEIGLAYNRFRYYSPESGTYISQDPIGLAGNNPNFYGYTFDCNTEVDVWGLDIHHIIPNEIYKEFRSDFKKIRKDGYIQNRSTKATDKTNLIDLDRPFHGNHPQYNNYVRERLEELKKNGNFNITEIKKLQDELKKHIADALNSDMNLNDYFKEGKHKNKH